MPAASLDSFATFCGRLKLENGQPFALEPFQHEMLADYFGGATETLILIPKKNGKSTLLGALALFHLLTTPSALCVVGAASRDQASILFDQAAGFVRRSPGLAEYIDVKKGYRELRSRRDDGRIRVLASDVDTADGVIPTLALVDELHRHRSADLYGVFRDGLGPRAGQMLTISTAGDDEETSPLGLMRRAAMRLPHIEHQGRHVRAASADGGYVMHEYALRPGDDRHDMAIVKEANPASWQTEAALAKRHDSASMTPWQWARFACGLWERGESTAIKPEEWDALKDTNATIPAGATIWVGLDLGWKVDTTGIVPIWIESPDRRVVGDVTVLEPTPDRPVDERDIVEALDDLRHRYEIAGIVYDPNAGAHQLAQQLEREWPDVRWVEHSQANQAMALASTRLDEAIRRGNIVHSGDTALRHHALNAVVKRLPGEQWKYDRPTRGGRIPIDLLTALEMGHSVAMATPTSAPRSADDFTMFLNS